MLSCNYKDLINKFLQKSLIIYLKFMEEKKKLQKEWENEFKIEKKKNQEDEETDYTKFLERNTTNPNLSKIEEVKSESDLGFQNEKEDNDSFHTEKNKSSISYY